MVMRKVMVAVLVTGLLAGNVSAMNGQNDKDPIEMVKNAAWNGGKGALIGGAVGMGVSLIGHLAFAQSNPEIPQFALLLSLGVVTPYLTGGTTVVGAKLGVLCAGLKSLSTDLAGKHTNNAIRSVIVYGGTMYLLNKAI